MASMSVAAGSEPRRVSLYENVARQMLHLIDQGTFKPGDRIPSVRTLSRQLKVSISTVMEAYRLMEDRGRIEARPQSGYYVMRPFPMLSEPSMSEPSSRPMSVSVSELIHRVRKDAHNPGLLKLGAATPNPELLPLDKLSRTLASVVRADSSLGSRYENALGNERLRSQIARRALATGCAMTPDEVIITIGCQEAVSLALSAVCKPGDTVAIESPIFYGILQAIESFGIRALEIPTHPRTGMCIDALTDALDRNDVRACVAMPNFNNPLGSLMPDDKKQALVQLLERRNIPLIEDDIYGELFYGEERPRVAKSFDKTGNVIFCSSFSKTVAPGYRVGWIAPGRFYSEVERQKVARNLSSPGPTQAAVAAFLENGGYDHHLRRIRRTYARYVSVLTQAVGAYFPEGTKVTRPAGGFVLWVELPEGVDSIELYQKAIQVGITLAPGPIFTAQDKYRNYIRLNAAFWSEKVEGAIAMLGRMVAGMC